MLWTTDEFGFARLDDAYATGSSMLPQKKNPDVAELARGKAGRLLGNLTGLLATLKGLPLAYNRDLQEDKEPLFDSVDQVSLALVALTGMIATAELVPERMAAAADVETSAATDLAEWLVGRGTPFREAHAIVGDLVRRHLATGTSLAELVAADDRFGPTAAELVGPGRAVRRRTSPGGAGPDPVAVQIERFGETLRRQRDKLDRRAWATTNSFGCATGSATCRGSCSTPTTSPTATMRSTPGCARPCRGRSTRAATARRSTS